MRNSCFIIERVNFARAESLFFRCESLFLSAVVLWEDIARMYGLAQSNQKTSLHWDVQDSDRSPWATPDYVQSANTEKVFHWSRICESS